MILLDTNVVSELMRPLPAPRVVAWLQSQPASALFLSSVSVGEISYGLACLAVGKRRNGLTERFERYLEQAFAGRIIAYDESAARRYVVLMDECRSLGRPISVPDGQIAATTLAHHVAVATRNTDDFEHSGLEVLNPFAAR